MEPRDKKPAQPVSSHVVTEVPLRSFSHQIVIKFLKVPDLMLSPGHRAENRTGKVLALVELVI